MVRSAVPPDAPTFTVMVTLADVAVDVAAFTFKSLLTPSSAIAATVAMVSDASTKLRMIVRSVIVKSTIDTVYPVAVPVNRIVSSTSAVVSLTGVIVISGERPSVSPESIVTVVVLNPRV